MYIKEENGYFNDGHETPAFLIWKGEVGGELIAGPMKEAEADKMIAELAYFLGVEIEKEGKIVGGKVVAV